MSTGAPDLEPRVSNVTLVGDSAASGVIILGIVGVIFGGVGGAVGFFTFMEGEWVGVVFGSIFGLVGLLCFVGAIVKYLASLRLDPPSITLSVSPLYLGETFHGEFTQRVKKAASINSVKLTLICREWVRYTQGTDTHTDTHDVYSVETTLDVSGIIEPPDAIQSEFEFQIPEEGMHSFSASDNQVNWLIEVHTDVADWPDYSSSFELAVAARLFNQEPGSSAAQIEDF